MLLAVGGNPRTIVGMLPSEVCPAGRFDLSSRTSPEQDDDVQDVVQKREYWDSSSKLCSVPGRCAGRFQTLTFVSSFLCFCAFQQNGLRSAVMNDRAAGFKVDSCYILHGGKSIKRGTTGEMVNTSKLVSHFIYHQI